MSKQCYNKEDKTIIHRYIVFLSDDNCTWNLMNHDLSLMFEVMWNLNCNVRKIILAMRKELKQCVWTKTSI